MVCHLLLISDAAYKKLKEDFLDVFKELDELEKESELIDNTPVAVLRKDFKKYLRALPVVGFNSGRYDINVIKPFLIKHLLETGPKTLTMRKMKTLKRQNVKRLAALLL
ncbi:hypothetical protein ElyMa_000794700 [Elysia marginata]|uniref:Uncharacterized protein n=1 Tax=Elysia marginata TaxID=1093978 RepID=A0AAV4GY72_9GAST|nr:hypothetical protein ElyMa_000794700 [Elysia marginata]